VLRETKPFAGATVVLVPEPDRRNQPHLYFNAQTDQSGRFVMRGIPPGQYALFAWERIDDGGYRDADTLRRYESLGRVLRVEGGATLTIELPVIPATHGRQ
jgi:hypothetical protein